MVIKVDRYFHGPESTLGKLYVDGEFECYTLEDAYRPKKIKGKTRIPSGLYAL